MVETTSPLFFLIFNKIEYNQCDLINSIVYRNYWTKFYHFTFTHSGNINQNRGKHACVMLVRKYNHSIHTIKFIRYARYSEEMVNENQRTTIYTSHLY